MYIKRKEFLRKKAAAITIQTHFRSYYARKQYKAKRREDLNRKCLTFYDQQATLIQKVFRGFLTRKILLKYVTQEHRILSERLAHHRSESVS